jgi:hypothetical protein
MTTINDLVQQDGTAGDDKVAVWSDANKATRGVKMSALAGYMGSTLGTAAISGKANSADLAADAGATLVGYGASTVDATLDDHNARINTNTSNISANTTAIGTKMTSSTLAAAGGAALVGNTPAGNIAATTVQGAINELDSEKVASNALAAANGAALIGFTDGQGNYVALSNIAKTQTLRNNKTTATVAGEVPGLKIGICDGTEAGWLLNPAAGDFVGIYPYVVSSPVRNRIWAMNPIIDIPAGSPATAWCYEGNINVGTANTPDPRSTNHAIGADMVSGGTYAPSAAFATNSTTLQNRWKHGLWFDNIGGQAGSTLIKVNANVSVDYGIDLGSATINKQGIRVGATTAAQVAAVGVKQLANGQVGIFLQRATDAAPTGNLLQVTDAANATVLASIDALGNITSKNITAPLLTNGSSVLAIGDAIGEIQIKKPLVSLGGGAAPTMGTIGGSGPASAAQNAWVRFLDSAGAVFWIPAWK